TGSVPYRSHAHPRAGVAHPIRPRAPYRSWRTLPWPRAHCFGSSWVLPLGLVKKKLSVASLPLSGAGIGPLAHGRSSARRPEPSGAYKESSPGVFQDNTGRQWESLQGEQRDNEVNGDSLYSYLSTCTFGQYSPVRAFLVPSRSPRTPWVNCPQSPG